VTGVAVGRAAAEPEGLRVLLQIHQLLEEDEESLAPLLSTLLALAPAPLPAPAPVFRLLAAWFPFRGGDAFCVAPEPAWEPLMWFLPLLELLPVEASVDVLC
jgi:hypothetical protein